VNVKESGSYSFSSKSSIIQYGHLYKDHFNPFNWLENILSEELHDCIPESDFGFTTDLQSNTTYILVLTKYDQDTISTFMIFASGSNNITFDPMSKYSYFLNDQHRSTNCKK
jgi:hypothetical protein